MAMRQAGAWLIIGGVILSILTTGVGIVSGSGAFSGQIRQADGTVSAVGPGYLLLAASLGLVGLGVALLSVSGPIYGGTLARRALMSMGFGLVALAVLLGMSTLPGFEGSNVMILFFPLLVSGWATIIGAGLTVVTLLQAGGRPRQVGATFLVAPIALFALILWGSALASAGDVASLVGAVLGVLALGAVLLGLLGLGLLAMRSDAARTEGLTSVAVPAGAAVVALGSPVAPDFPWETGIDVAPSGPEDRSTPESTQDEPSQPADGWVLPKPPPDPSSRRVPLARSVGWAVLVWIMTLAAVYLINEILAIPAGLCIAAGLIFGVWFGGTYGGIKGGREWGMFGVVLFAVAVLLLPSLVAMAFYG
jgi:hypothetical protein